MRKLLPYVAIERLLACLAVMLTVTLTNGESVEAGAVFSAQEGKTVRTVSYITAAAAALAFLWLAVLTTLFAKSRRTAVHR